ncbi:MAG TPA: hypothetical protein VGC41_09550, partial [Kofleriaceae bacterium]
TDAHAAMLAVPFRIVAFGESDHLTCDLTVADRAKVHDAVKCITDAGPLFSDLKPVTKKLLANLGELSDYKAEIQKLQATTVLLGHTEKGEGAAFLTIVAITQDTDGKAKIAAIYAWVMTF